MYKLEFTLKQHTPLIHFQHDQAGATLRATEVKPKLDRFIIEKLLTEQNIPFDYYETTKDGQQKFVNSHEAFRRTALEPKNKSQEKWRNWLVGKGSNEHVALDYKLHIFSKDQMPDRNENIKLITDADKTSTKSSDIIFSLRSLNDNLTGSIRTNIDEFFIVNSFGNRQSKGFGCFYPDYLDTWDKVKKIIAEKGILTFVSKEELRTNSLQRNGSSFPFYELISRQWRILKSGINLYDRNGNQTEYKKSLLFKYLNNKGIRWDKRWIKIHLKQLIDSKILPAEFSTSSTTTLTEPNDCCDFKMNYSDEEGYNGWINNKAVNYPFKFGRAMLGLAEHYEFRARNGYIYKVSVKNDNGFERFKAPITFKVYNKHLFVIINSIPDELFNQNFSFEVQQKLKRGNEIIDVGKPIIFTDNKKATCFLPTPSDSNEFSIKEFSSEFFIGLGFNQLHTSNIKQL
jgi:hypothetical protein